MGKFWLKAVTLPLCKALFLYARKKLSIFSFIKKFLPFQTGKLTAYRNGMKVAMAKWQTDRLAT